MVTGGTGAATVQANGEASKSTMLRVALQPRLTWRQKQSRPTPYGETTPIPVIATRGPPLPDIPPIIPTLMPLAPRVPTTALVFAWCGAVGFAVSLLFFLDCAGWRHVPGELYHLGGAAAGAGYALQGLAIWLTARSSARLDVLDLAGVRPLLARGVTPPGPHAQADHVPLITTGLYGFVRHPLYFSWALLVFAAPHMTMTRFTFALLSTGYLAIAIP